MTTSEFIFSEKKINRLQRHGLFWILFSVHVYVFRFYVVKLIYLFTGTTYLVRLEDTLLFLPVSFFYAYFALYILLPGYILRKRYQYLLLILCGMGILVVLFSWALSALFDIKLAWDLPLRRPGLVSKIDFILNNGIVYPLTVSGFAIGIKMGKNFYLEQQQNEQLAIQKINADVRMLKSRVYPRFLFQSLKTIHHDMLRGAEQSPAMLLKLSELLSYILYESDARVPLEKELQQVKHYAELEEKGHADTLVVYINDSVDQCDKFIEPLLLLPLLEYIFESIDKYRDLVFVLTLNMSMKGNTFIFNLHISTPVQNKWNQHMGTKILPVEQRLIAQYPGKHRLRINATPGELSVILRLTPDAAD